MNSLLQEKSFNNILDDDNDDNVSKYYDEFKIYQTKSKAIYALRSGRPLSSFYLQHDNQTYYVGFRDRGEIHAIEFHFFIRL